LKESKRAVNSLRDFVDDDDDDDLERVSWTGEPVGSKLKRPLVGFLSVIKAVPLSVLGAGQK
ncbi:VPS33B-interacting protein isoform 4, partial [Cricetulus griseus]